MAYLIDGRNDGRVRQNLRFKDAFGEVGYAYGLDLAYTQSDRTFT